MSIFSEIEKSIERGFRRWTERAFGAANSDELVLVHRAILEEIGTKVQTASRGQRMFPYTRLVVTLVSPDPDRRALYQAAFGERLGTEVRKELEAVHCEVPRSFAVEVRTAEDGPKTFDIQYEIAKRAAAPMTPGRLTVVRGKAVEAEYGLTQRRTNIGRNAELTDTEQRVVRRNDIVFEEGADEANGTVSRGHAHIRHEDGEYRLCDDGSEYGTRIFREGRSLAVPSGGRGEKLRPGDEIYVGRACLRFER